MGYVRCDCLSTSDCWTLAYSFSIVVGEVAQPPVLLMHTAMLQTIIVPSLMYIITASSYEYKDGVVGTYVLGPLVF